MNILKNKIMKKFYVTYREYTHCAEYAYYSIMITLNQNEKANPLTFNDKLKEKGLCNYKEIMSWSLIEE
jgi:hypothetical protein